LARNKTKIHEENECIPAHSDTRNADGADNDNSSPQYNDIGHSNVEAVDSDEDIPPPISGR
jgi:hypothetical protein